MPKTTEQKAAEPGIGRLNESRLHAALKARYASQGGSTEQLKDRWVCDVCQRDGTIVEIQTGSFAPLYKKVSQLSLYNPVRIVHPIPLERRIQTLDAAGSILRTRKSPKKGSHWEVFDALVHAPLLPLLPRCTIELLMVGMTEVRIDDGKGSWRRKGIRIMDRILDEVFESVVLSTPDDWQQFVPAPLRSQTFTSGDLAVEAGIRRALAGKVLYVLSKSGFIIEEKRIKRFKGYRWTGL
jgi:hypothetical protein